MPTETVCEKCGGTGWIIVERASVSGAEACGCRDQGRAERLEDRAQIPPLYRSASFDKFNAAYDPRFASELRRVLGDLKKYVDNFPLKLERPGILLIGDPGTGKTHLAVAALRRIIGKTNIEGLFCDYQNLLDRIRSGYDSASNSSDKEAYRVALDTEVLVLDDLGAHRVTDWVLDTITSIITYRCNNQKALIATTNLPVKGANDSVSSKSPTGATVYQITLEERIGDRACSRLSEMCTFIKMPPVDDYRIGRGRPRF